jgi:hypothetical protein
VPGIKLNPHAFPLVTPMEPPVYPNVPPTFEMQAQYLLMVRQAHQWCALTGSF